MLNFQSVTQFSYIFLMRLKVSRQPKINSQRNETNKHIHVLYISVEKWKRQCNESSSHNVFNVAYRISYGYNSLIFVHSCLNVQNEAHCIIWIKRSVNMNCIFVRLYFAWCNWTFHSDAGLEKNGYDRKFENSSQCN